MAAWLVGWPDGGRDGQPSSGQKFVAVCGSGVGLTLESGHRDAMRPSRARLFSLDEEAQLSNLRP